MNKPKENQPASSKSLEVGVVYRHLKEGHLFLAMGPLLLVGYVKGQRVEAFSSAEWVTQRTCSVAVLLDHWKITVDEFDRFSVHYLNPLQNKSTTRQRGRKGRPENQEEIRQTYREIRLHRSP